MTGLKVTGGLGPDGGGGHEERRMFAGTVEVQGRCRVAGAGFLQAATESTVGGMRRRTAEVIHAQASGFEHPGNRLGVAGLAFVGRGRQCRPGAGHLLCEAHRGNRLQRFEARSGEHGRIRCAQADQGRSIRVEDDGGTDVAGFDEPAALDEGQLGGVGGNESGTSHALKPTTL